jgi:hypothetical protein
LWPLAGVAEHGVWTEMEGKSPQQFMPICDVVEASLETDPFAGIFTSKVSDTDRHQETSLRSR